MNKLDMILEIYAQWAEDIFGEEIEIRWCTDFGCYPQDRDEWLIEIGLLATENNFADLPDFFQENFQCDWEFEEIQFYTLCFLHECGHLDTWEWLTPKERKREKSGITWEEYRRLPTEMAADEWANNYLNQMRPTWEYYQARLERAYSEVTEKDLENFLKSLDN